MHAAMYTKEYIFTVTMADRLFPNKYEEMNELNRPMTNHRIFTPFPVFRTEPNFNDCFLFGGFSMVLQTRRILILINVSMNLLKMEYFNSANQAKRQTSPICACCKTISAFSDPPKLN